MAFAISSRLLDAMILATVSQEDSYGYRITQDIGDTLEVSESTLYPVLRRLQKDKYLETYDKEHMGRNRRYYKITDIGAELLKSYKAEWTDFKVNIEKILFQNDIL
jgi:PadR family transcriptional regulator PadR